MTRTPHILLISLPFQGHISPMMQFTKRLASKGLQVTFLCPSSTIVLNNKINVEYIDYENDRKAQNVEEYMANIERQASDKLVRVIEKQKECGEPFEVLVHDSLMPWAVDLGRQHGLRVASFFTQTCVFSAIYYLVFQGKLKVPREEGSDLSFLPSSIPIEVVRELRGEHPGVSDLLASQFSRVHEDDWILFNTFLELENEVSFVEYIIIVEYYTILVVPSNYLYFSFLNCTINYLHFLKFLLKNLKMYNM